MKKIRHVALLMVFVLIGFLLCVEGAVSSGKRYTVIVYLAADNNLGGGTPSDFDFMDFDEMEKALVTSGANADIVVLWDRPGTNDTAIYWVQADPLEGTLATYTQDVNRWYIPASWAFTYPGGYPQGAGSPSEENMGSGATLTAFLDWCYLNFDSDYYALILWNHGAGWEPMSPAPGLPQSPPPLLMPMREGTTEPLLMPTVEKRVGVQSEPAAERSRPARTQSAPLAEATIKEIDEKESPILRGVCWDDTNGSDYLTTKELATAIDVSTIEYVENLGFDACLMQMLEVAYEVQTVAWYMTGSQESEPACGWSYDEMLGGITATISPLGMAQKWGWILWTVAEIYTISSLDLSQVGTLASDVSALADRLSTLLSDAGEYWSMMAAKTYCFAFAAPEYLDLDRFCRWIDMFVSDATAGTLAQAVRTQISNTVIADSWTTDYSSAWGISIYLPHYHNIMYEGIAHANYNGTNFAFCADHSWDEFVNSFLATDHADPYEPNDTPATAHYLAVYPPGGGIYLFLEADFADDTAGLVDWYKFTTQTPSELTIWAKCTEWDSDTRIYLYNSLANAEEDQYFAWDDDSGYGYGSYLTTESVPIGTYYLKVASWDKGGGAREDYVLWIEVEEAPLPDTGAVFRVSELGDVFSDADLYGASVATGQADVAEWVPVSEPVQAGDVLELDPLNPGFYRRARTACSTLVAGVVSSDPGVVLGGQPSTPGSELSTPDSSLGTIDSRLSTRDSHSALLAVIGIVPVKVTDAGGPIAVGDLLVASSEPGTARRWTEEDGPNCGFIGKALEPLEGGTGMIRVLLMR
jgi:hypothetical protein